MLSNLIIDLGTVSKYYMNNYYCVLPYFSLETGFDNLDKNIFCCRIAPNSNINDIRSSIAQGKRNPACGACWQLEDRSLKSERQLHNDTMDFLLDLNLDNIEKQSKSNGFDPLQIKLTTSNLCNGTCVTCNSQLSSAWAALEGASTQYRSMDLAALSVDWSKIVSLSFVGGEPFLERKNFELLQKLIDMGNTACLVSFVTNGSIALSNRQLSVLEQFSNINICVSIDGVGKSFEYMRFPFKWDLLESNIRLFKTIAKHVSVSCMISNLNIYYYSDLVRFFKDNQLHYLCKSINDPAMFSPANLTNSAKQTVLQHNSEYADEVRGFLNLHDFNQTLYQAMLNELQRQDQLKRIRLADYMPAVSNLL